MAVPRPDGGSGRRSAEEVRESLRERVNANRQARGLRALEQWELEERNALVMRYETLGPGPERDELMGKIELLDGRRDKFEKSVAMPTELRETLATIALPAGLRPDQPTLFPLPPMEPKRADEAPFGDLP